jgi:hypothetical protein
MVKVVSLKKNDYPKVLVAIPTYSGKDYIFKENFQAVKNLDYPNYEYVYIDNSKGSSYAKKLRLRGANVVRVNRGANSRQALCNAQNYARNKVLNEGYDYLLFVESDLVPDKDVITRLMRHGRQVVGSVYFLESESYDLVPPHKVDSFLLGCAYLGVDTSNLDLSNVQSKGYLETNGLRMRIPCIFYLDKAKGGTRMIKPQEIPELLKKNPSQVHGCGLGCTLIRRDIVQKYSFWWDENDVNKNKHSDVYFYMDLHRDGVGVFVDTTREIPHYPSKWEDVADR